MPHTTMVNTKITIPKLVSTSITRERLLQLLEHGKTKKITIIRAPAGYGKTTLLSQWAIRSKNQTAWVSLDYTDNDPIRFWQSIAKTIGTVIQTDLYERLLPLFQTQPRISIELFVDLINQDIKDNPSTIQLILDNYQAITHSIIHRSMTRFITYLPENIRVFIASQNELPLPLLKWKSKSFVQELTTTTIKFNYKETAYYLKKRSLLSDDLNTVHKIHKKTEGWPTGINILANISGKKLLDRIDEYQFNGENPLKTYSNEETTFLLQNSVLRYIEPELYKKITEETSTFCYHPIFGNLLKTEMISHSSSTELKLLYSRAALQIYKQNDYMIAIDIALRAEIFELALKWIDEHVIDVFKLGQTETFVGWIDLVVEKKQEISPDLIVMQAFALALLGDFGRALFLIQQLEERNDIEQRMNNKDYQTTVYDFLGTKAYILAVGLNDMKESICLTLEQLKHQSENSKIDKILIRYNLFNSSLLRTRIGANGKLLTEDALENFATTIKNTEYKNLKVSSYMIGVIAETLVERNQIDEALPQIKEAIRIGRYFNDPGIVVPMILLKCQIEMDKQRFKEVIGSLERLETYVLSQNERHWLESIHAMRAKLFVQQNKNVEAEHELSKVNLLDQYIGGTENEFCWLVYVRFLIQIKEYERGLQTIKKIKRVAVKEKQVSAVIEASLLEATIHKLAGNNRLALDALHTSLAFGYPYGYIRSFVREIEIISLIQKYVTLRKKRQIHEWRNIPTTYAEKIIEAVNKERLTLSHLDMKNPLNELTPRELEVLSHLANGLTNREIATELFLSPGTVRIYLSNIYAKLKVNSRTQAVIIAKQNTLN